MADNLDDTTGATWESQFSHRCNLIDGRTRI